MNAVCMRGRLVCGLEADWVLGPVDTLTTVAFVTNALLYSWATVDSVGGLFIFCVIYGFFAVGTQSLFPAACASLTINLNKIGVTNVNLFLRDLCGMLDRPAAGRRSDRNGSLRFSVYSDLWQLRIHGWHFDTVAARIAKKSLNVKSRM
jgi:hypothetical protein